MQVSFPNHCWNGVTGIEKGSEREKENEKGRGNESVREKTRRKQSVRC
jgi:hypothetical protein